MDFALIDRAHPEKPARLKAAQAAMVAGLACLAFSTLAAWQGKEPFASWLFQFAWWGYILLVDGWVYRKRGESLLLTYPGRFLFLALWSVVFWAVFEAMNFRLGNWSYWNLPGPMPARWLGYALAFATVVPALFETGDWLQTAGVIKEIRIRGLKKKRVEGLFLALGAAMLLLPLIWPRLFFPLVWGGLVFLLEPFNERWGGASFLSDARLGRLRRLVLFLAAGAFCGLLWESWNHLSRARWSYSIPWAGRGKIFEMPFLGYLGFPPFALEAFAGTSFALTLWEKIPLWFRVVLGAAAFVFCAAVFSGIDHLTVKSLR